MDKRLTLAVACAWLLLLAGAMPALAHSDSCGVKEAKARERAAHKALVRARAEYSTARAVTRATRALTAQYGWKVGRWVWLADDVGWPRSTWGQLAYVIDRESGGAPTAKNPTSTASGLLQFLAMHFDGSGDYGWRFDPFDPRDNLRYGHKLYLKCGWSPWRAY